MPPLILPPLKRLFGCLAISILPVLFTTGCNSTAISDRIKENPSVFDALLPDQKTYLQDGIVFPGDTPEMTYIALGKPTTVETKQKGDVTVEMWTYKKYYPSGEFADFLTEYSLSRNANLQRELNLESGEANINANAPGLGKFGSPGLFDTEVSEGNDLSLPDIPVYNLYVFFHKNKIVDVKLESIDQTKFNWLEEAIEMEQKAKG